MNKIIILIFFILLGGINQSFGAVINTKTTTYSSNSVTECSGSLDNISGEKYIPTSNNSNVNNSGNIDCSSYIFFYGEWSDFINKNTIKSCNDIAGNYSYVGERKCYDSSSNEQTCTTNGSGWTKYKIYCKYEFHNENVLLDTSNFNNFWYANGNIQNIKISFPFSTHDLESYLSKLKFNFDIKDNTSLNWYTEDKNSSTSTAVGIEGNDKTENFVGEQRNIIYDLNNTTKINNYKNSDELDFDYKFYNSTLEANTLNNGFLYNNIKYDIEFNDGGKVEGIYVFSGATEINNSNIPLKIKNLYNISFSGAQTNSGFIEGVTQSGTINIAKNSTASDNNGKILLTKSGSVKNDFNGTGAINKASIVNGTNFKNPGTPDLSNSYSFYNTNNTENKNFLTLFTLDPNSSNIGDIKDLYIYSYIRYYLDGKNITYPGQIIGGTTAINQGIKIYGNTNINNLKIKNITINQNNNDIHNIAGNINKATLKQNIIRNAYSIIRNIKIDSSNNNGEEISIGNNYLYYNFSNGNEGGIKKITTNYLTSSIQNKTIIIKGGNLYIKPSSGIEGTNGNYFPGVIILKANNGKGGNLYIDPDINRLDGVFYVDKSIISYNDIIGCEISPDHGGTYEILKNQLFINGSIFSNNTIGGSRKNNPVCPFYLNYTQSQCTLDESQKYDLNYLRRGIENKSDSTLADYPVIIKYSPKLQLNPPKLFSN